MKRIYIYANADAKKAIRKGEITGMQASLKKWESIVGGLEIIYNEMITDCGLCIEREHCADCPLVNCGENDGKFQKAAEALGDAYDRAKEMQEYLGSVDNDELQELSD